MTPGQWADVCDEVAGLWGKSGRWANAHTLASRVQAVKYDAAMHVVRSAMSAGDDLPPAPAAVIGLAKSEDRTDPAVIAVLAAAHCDAADHLWAVKDEIPFVCARCGHEPVDSGPLPV